MKDRVFASPMHDLLDLRRIIVDVITPKMLVHTWDKIEYYIEILRAMRGAYIEVH